jgi:hypothetical protein
VSSMSIPSRQTSRAAVLIDFFPNKDEVTRPS